MSGILRFGSFTLDQERRILCKADGELRLGTRAMDVLLALTHQPGGLMTVNGLLRIVDAGRVPNEAALRVYISEVRRALSDGIDGARFIINEHGRGYRFVAPIETATSHLRSRKSEELPVRIGRVIGRETTIDAVLDAFRSDRLVTLVGPGGIGKSTAALAAAEKIAEHQWGGVRFVDLALIEDEARVSQHLTASLGLQADTASSGHAIGLALGEVLLVIDNCEHLLAVVSNLVSELLGANTALRIITTSREPLRVAGERILRIAGMATPPEEQDLTPKAALRYAAVDLFVERAVAASSRFALTSANVATVASLCRRLDGIPLALEFAAGWIDLIGIEEITAGLDSRLLLLTGGRRTALPRHRTLHAVLDWSYRTLSPRDQELLEAFSTFRGGFTAASGLAIAGPGWTLDEVCECTERLGDKSLLSVDRKVDPPRYRLLETTRSYASKHLQGKPKQLSLRARHARHCVDLVSGADKALLNIERREWVQKYMPLLADVQYAFDWCFSPDGDGRIGVALAQESIQLGMQSVLPDTFRAYFSTALAYARVRQDIDAGSYQKLSFGHAMIQMDKDGETTSHKVILQTNATRRGEETPEILASGFADAFTEGDYGNAGRYAARIRAVGENAGQPEVMYAGMRMTSQVLHHLGRHTEAAELSRQVLACPMKFLPFTSTWHQISMRINLARIAFMQGDPDLASEYSAEATALAVDLNPITLCQTLTHSEIPVRIWTGDLLLATERFRLLKATSDRQGLRFWNDWTEGIGLALELLDRNSARIDAEVMYKLSVRPLPAKVVDLLTTLDTRLLTRLARERVEKGLVGWCAPEVVRAEALAAPDAETRRQLLLRALHLATEQGAETWASRAEADLLQLRPTASEGN